MNDIEFVEALETCRLPEDHFHHRDHIRLAWIYVQRYGEEAPARISQSIRRYAAHLGKADRYHETITMAWLALVRDASQGAGSFDDVIARAPHLLDKAYLSNFYSPDVLESQGAKTAFVEPNLHPLHR